MSEFYLNKVTIGANMGQSIGEPLHFGNFTGCAAMIHDTHGKRNSEETYITDTTKDDKNIHKTKMSNAGLLLTYRSMMKAAAENLKNMSL